MRDRTAPHAVIVSYSYIIGPIYYSGNLSFFLSSGTELDSKMVDSDSGEEGNERKNHYSAIEEIINSTQKEVKTDSVSNYRQNTESANVVSQVLIFRQTFYRKIKFHKLCPLYVLELSKNTKCKLTFYDYFDFQ